MQIVNYFEQSTEEKEYLKQQISTSEWRAASFLHKLLDENKLQELYGTETKLLMLVEDKTLFAFCTLAERDEIEVEEMKPWIGFVYTYPEYRGNRYSEKLINYACDLARNQGEPQVYLSSNEIGLYEKYGFEFISHMKTVWGEETQVFMRKVN